MATHILKLGTGFLLALGTTLASAQTSHPVSVGANYTYVRTNILPSCNCFSLNGGGAQLLVGMTPRISFLADLTLTHKNGITPDNYSLGQFTYTFGTRFWPVAPRARLRPFGEIKLGAAHDFGSLAPARTVTGGSSNAFAFETGGGLDLRLRSRLTLVPLQVNYLMTTFSNGADNQQNDLRVSAGITFRLHR